MHRAPEPLIRYITKDNIEKYQALCVYKLKVGMKVFLGVDYIYVMRETQGGGQGSY